MSDRAQGKQPCKQLEATPKWGRQGQTDYKGHKKRNDEHKQHGIFKNREKV